MPNTKKYTPEEEAIIAKQKAAIAADPRVRKQKATPEGGRRGFRAGMTGTSTSKSQAARPRIDVMGPTPNAMKTSKDLVKEAVKQGVKTPKINLDPPKKAAAKKDKEGEDFAKSMRKNYKKFGSGDAKTRKGKANVSKEQLDAFGGTGTPAQRLTQYMNQWNKTGKRPTKAPAVKKTEKKVAKKADPKKKSFRERRAERLKDRLASESVGEGRKKRIKRRLSRVEGRIEKAKDKKEEKARKPKKYATGDMHEAYGVGGKKGKSKPKVRGAGIERKGLRPAKMR